jgi:hypothetical protein
MRRATQPLNPQASTAANRELLEKHPDLAGPDGKVRPLDPKDPRASKLRTEWMDSYAAHGGQVETVHPEERPQQAQQAQAAARQAPTHPPALPTVQCPGGGSGAAGGRGGAGSGSGSANTTGKSPPASKARKTCPNGKTCSALALKLNCSHDGRAASTADHLLEVVPAEAGDVIKLSAQGAACGEPPTWTVSGVLSRQEKAQATSFRAQRWLMRAALSTTWAGSVVPQTFRVSAATRCGFETASHTVRAFPGDKFTLSINGKEWATMKSRIDYAVETFLAAYLKDPKFEFLVGKGEISAGWEEDGNSHLAFYAWKVSLGFDPLFGAKVRIPFGPLAAIPNWIKKYGDAYFFVEFGGGISLTGEWGRTGPKKLSGSLKATGKVGGKIGGSMFMVSKTVISMEVAGSSGVSIEATPDYSGYENPAIVVEGKWDGLKAEVTLIAARGIVEVKREFAVCDAKTIIDKRPFFVFQHFN